MLALGSMPMCYEVFYISHANSIRRVVLLRGQVSWCALEVALDSPKCIASAGASGPQEPPPLVVAALNLKTTLHLQVGYLGLRLVHSQGTL